MNKLEIFFRGVPTVELHDHLPIGRQQRRETLEHLANDGIFAAKRNSFVRFPFTVDGAQGARADTSARRVSQSDRQRTSCRRGNKTRFYSAVCLACFLYDRDASPRHPVAR